MSKKSRLVINAVFASSLALGSSSALANGYGNASYKVTITNLTHSINFTPALVASHRYGVSIHEEGAPASVELTAIAEGGDTAPMEALLTGNPRVKDVQNSGVLLGPGESVSVTVNGRSSSTYISMASMMLPTNDGYIALNGVRAPRHGSVTYYSPGYDAGTEPNDELCAHIPGPTCGGAGASPGVDGEGFVYINRGIHGVGDLAANVYDWRNPVAKITIKRVWH